MQRTAKRKQFTAQMVDRISPPKTGRLELGDSVCPGLVLRVTSQGTKTFSVIYKVPGEGGISPQGRLLKGHQHRVTLGRWPILDLSSARNKACKVLQQATEGNDPRQTAIDRNLERQANSVAAVVDRFIAQECKPNIKSWRNTERVLRLHVVSAWGPRPLVDIARADVHELLDGLVENGKIGTAREVRKHLSKLFNWSVNREIVLDSPLHSLQRGDLRQAQDAGRALSNDELRSIWLATYEMEYPFGPLYQLLMLTGQRRSEWAAATWSEINEAEHTLEISKSRYKGGRDHVVPLSDTVWTVVASLPRWAGENKCLFSTTNGSKPISGFSRAKYRLDTLASKHFQKLRSDETARISPYRVHDFRVTCETRLVELGFGQEVRDAVLGHARAGLQKVYNKHDYLEEKRAAVESYADHIIGVVK